MIKAYSSLNFIITFAGVVWFTLLVLLFSSSSSARPLYKLPSKDHRGTKQPLQTSRPYNLAHRGSNGEFPEETAAAYWVRFDLDLCFRLICM